MPQTTARQLLDTIYKALEPYAREEPTPGLMNGTCGFMLYYAYYYRFSGKAEALDRLGALAAQCLEQVAQQPAGLSFCNGIAGIGWTLQHLVNMGLAGEEDFGSLLADCDDVLAQYLAQELPEGRHDFLHEGLGVALYFLERLPQPGARVTLERFVKFLAGTALPLGAGIGWPDNFSTKDTMQETAVCFNLGLAHGFPAVISILSLICAQGIAQEQCRSLIRRAADALQGLPFQAGDDVLSLYPRLVTSQGLPVLRKTSRLGWCYGDLCVAQALLHAGRQLEDSRYLSEATRILKQVLTCRDKENGSIADAGLCHGAAGIAHILRRAYRDSGAEYLRQGAARWLEETLAMSRHADGIAGFKAYTLTSLCNNPHFLDGVAGIGLSLIAALDEEAAPGWDRCLLLS